MLSAGRLGRRARQIAAVTALALGVAPIALVAGSASAATPPAEAELLTVAPVDPLLKDGEDLELEIALAERDGEAVGRTTVELLITSQPISTRYALTRWLSGDGVLASSALASVEIPEGEPGETQRVKTTIPADTVALAGRPWGAFGLAANAENIETATSVVVHDEPGEASPTRLALAAPIDAGARVPLLDANQLDAAVAPESPATLALDAASDAGITIGIDPVFVASDVVLGDDSPEAAAEWIERADGPRTYPLLYANADPIAQVRAGAYPVAPLGFPREGARTLTPSAARIGDRDPAFDATSAILNGDDLRGLSSAGTVVMSTAGLGEVLVGSTPSSHVVVEGQSVLAADSELQAMVRAATTSTDTSAADSRARVLALIATITRERPSDSRTLAAMLPPASQGDVAPLLEALSAASFIETTTLDEALEVEPRPGSLVAPPDSTRDAGSALVREALGLEAEGVKIASIVANPSSLVADLRLSLLAALPKAGATITDRDAEVVAGFRGGIDEVRSAASILESSVIRATGQSLPLPITLSNELEVPVTVRLSVRPTNALVTVPNAEIDVTIPAARQERVQVPIEIVGAGTVLIDASLSTPDGVPLGEARIIRVQTQPTIEAFVGWTLGSAIALLLGFGVWRSVRKRRRGEAHGDLDDREIAVRSSVETPK